MRTITGIFTDAKGAMEATAALQRMLGEDNVNLLAPASTESEIDEVPTTEDMPPVGGTMGGIIGGALGVSTSLAIPGVGQVMAVGVAAAAILGTLGGVAGYKLGDKADRVASTGLPADELYYYKDALKNGRLVVFATVAEKDDEDEVRRILGDNGAQSLDAARDEWSVGMKDAAELDYDEETEENASKS